MMIRMLGAACAALLVCGAIAVASPEVAKAQDVGLVSDASIADVDSASDATLIKDDADDKKTQDKTQDKIQAEKEDKRTEVKEWDSAIKGNKKGVDTVAEKIKGIYKEIEKLKKDFGGHPKKADYEWLGDYFDAVKAWEEALSAERRKKWDEAKKNLERKSNQLEIWENAKKLAQKERKRAEDSRIKHCKDFPLEG